MDVLRTLMMTNRAEYGNSMVQCFQSVFHQNGIRGIYRGMVVALLIVHSTNLPFLH
jgi:hypothetical protein